ncbi:hypothetical protein [Priestia sp. TSO9]|uniref:hypothetical protein n=1 Tax=Priestia sp. TSO9 TaxID=2885632 RepID=UPI001E44F5FB|nr:hypothetical protein [Priestia sp. TSO9]
MGQLQTLSVEEQETLLDNAQINAVAAKQLVQKMSQFVGGYELNNRKGFKFEQDDVSIQTVILANAEDTIKVIYTNLNNEEAVSGSVIVEKDDKKILKGYDIIEDEVTKTLETEIDDEFLAELKELENRELPEADADHEEVVAQLPCIYGKWCGPGCSGPGTPISKVDACCKTHDGCYGSRGYFACSCDKNLHTCLAPYVKAGSEWAITINSYFYAQPCNPFK